MIILSNSIKLFYALLRYGKRLEPFMPWHISNRAYNWIIAEIMMRRTTRTAVKPIYIEFIKKYPSFKTLSKAHPEDIFEIISPLGLMNQRTNQIMKLAKDIKSLYKNRRVLTPEKLMKLPGIGKYISDVIMLYVYSKSTFPVDSNVIRVMTRSLGLNFYYTNSHLHNDIVNNDIIARQLKNMIPNKFGPKSIKYIHLAILYIGWEFCRYKPKCNVCPINHVCNCFSNRRAIS